MASRPKSPTGSGAHMPALDGARGLAILLVLVYHAEQRWHVPPLLRLIVAAGWSGVDLFFVISGFLITGILLRGRGVPGGLGKFLFRRALRIFPLAYAVLLLCYVLSQFHFHDFPELPSQAWTWFALYGGNFYVMIHGWPLISGVAVMWSLAIEEQFYLVWPLVARFAPRWLITLIAIALLAGAPMFRVWLWPDYGILDGTFTLGRCDGLAAGALLALAFERPSWQSAIGTVGSVLAIPALALSVATASVDFGEPTELIPYRFSVVALGYVPLVAAAAAPRPFIGRVLRMRWLRWMGERSYGIYLFQCLVTPPYHELTSGWLDDGVASIVGWIVSVCALAELSFRFFERPILGLREAFDGWRRPSAAH